MLSFVDSIGGGLASLAASLAAASGRTASACTTSSKLERPEVAEVLAEVGASVVPAEQRAPDSASVWVGPAPAESSQRIDVALYEGPDPTPFGAPELERLALARIARDRIERWLRSATP